MLRTPVCSTDILSGATCGSSLLNLAFRRWFEEKLYHEKNKYIFSGDLYFRLADRATDAFELAKRGFSGMDNRPLEFPVIGLKKTRDESFTEDHVAIPESVSQLRLRTCQELTHVGIYCTVSLILSSLRRSFP